MSFARIFLLCLLLSSLGGCGDNLAPSGTDHRAAGGNGTVGAAVGQQAADFAVADSNGQQVTKAAALAGAQGAVFYFTMWCPICDGHMSHLREMLPLYPGVRFFLVDYVSGSITAAGDAAAASGYGNGPFTVLADVAHQLYGNFQATMGTTVVVDGGGVIRLNEDFRDGRNLRAELDLLVLN